MIIKLQTAQYGSCIFKNLKRRICLFSPITSPLPGPSSAHFSFFPDEVEPQEASSSQERPLKDRIKSVIDRVGYEVYSSLISPPIIMPEEVVEATYPVDKKSSLQINQNLLKKYNKEFWIIQQIFVGGLEVIEYSERI